MNAKRILAAVLVATLSSSCATRTIYLCPELPEPARPSVPRVMDGALECVADIDAQRLAERERRLVEYAEDMETIISTHNRNCRGMNGAE